MKLKATLIDAHKCIQFRFEIGLEQGTNPEEARDAAIALFREWRHENRLDDELFSVWLAGRHPNNNEPQIHFAGYLCEGQRLFAKRRKLSHRNLSCMHGTPI